MTCFEVREILSDLIDVRNGEIPPVGVSRLSLPEIRADAESHLAGCTDCRAELAVFEEVGAAFAEFAVGELPAQHFADYGQVIRERMTRETERKIVPIRATAGASRWWKIAASTAVAACTAFAFLHFSPKHAVKTARPVPVIKAQPYTPIPRLTLPTPIDIENAVLQVGEKPQRALPKRDWVLNPDQPEKVLNELVQDEGRCDHLLFGEKVAAGQSPLLGVVLRPACDKEDEPTKSDAFGIEVFDTVPDSVANEMGLRSKDRIVCINGLNVNTGNVKDVVRFIEVVHNLGKSAVVTLDIVRQDKNGILYIQRRGVLGEPKAVFE